MGFTRKAAEGRVVRFNLPGNLPNRPPSREELKRIIARRGAGRPEPIIKKRILPPRSFDSPKLALVVVDMLRTQINESKVGYPWGSVSDGIKRFEQLLGLAKKLKIPIVFIMPHPEYKVQFGSTTIVPSLRSLAPDAPVIVKDYENSFRRTTLASHLDSLGVNTLVIGGWDFRMCVRATVNAALNRNYRVITSDEICFSNILCDIHGKIIALEWDKDGRATEHPATDKWSEEYYPSIMRHYLKIIARWKGNPRVDYQDRFDDLMVAVENTARWIDTCVAE